MNSNEIELIQLLDKQIFPYVFPLIFVGLIIGYVYFWLVFRGTGNYSKLKTFMVNSMPWVLLVCMVAAGYGRWDDNSYSAKKLRIEIGTISEEHPGEFAQSSKDFVMDAYAKCYGSGYSGKPNSNSCSKSYFYNTFLPRMNAPVVTETKSHSLWWFIGGVVVVLLLIGKRKGKRQDAERSTA